MSALADVPAPRDPGGRQLAEDGRLVTHGVLSAEWSCRLCGGPLQRAARPGSTRAVIACQVCD